MDIRVDAGYFCAVARLTSLQKAERVLRFVLSLRNPVISSVLVAHGFAPKDLDEVWTLFRAAAPVSFAKPVPVDDQVIVALRQVRGWQRRWRPIITVSLARHMPAVASAWEDRQKETLASKPIGWAVRFVAFYDRLAESRTGKAAKEGRGAIKLLASRGLTPEVVEELRALTTTAMAPTRDSKPPTVPETTPDIDEAIGKLWDWYLEWGQVARTQISDGRILRQAGFLSGDRRSKPVRGKAKRAGAGG